MRDEWKRYAVALVLVAASIMIAGCFAKRAAAPAGVLDPPGAVATVGQVLQTIGTAPAASAVAQNMRNFFATGLGFIILGGFVVCLGGRGTGLTLIIMGILTTGTGVLFVQYPWSVLVLMLLVGVVVVIVAVGQIRAHNARAAADAELARTRTAVGYLAETIESAPAGKDIKASLKAKGPTVANAVRQVVTPIKMEMAGEG